LYKDIGSTELSTLTVIFKF